jgi:hypothetical protein
MLGAGGTEAAAKAMFAAFVSKAVAIRLTVQHFAKFFINTSCLYNKHPPFLKI